MVPTNVLIPLRTYILKLVVTYALCIAYDNVWFVNGLMRPAISPSVGFNASALDLFVLTKHYC